MNEHNCQEFQKSKQKPVILSKGISYGPAISYIYFDSITGKWIACNDEYDTYVDFCPFCGHQLNTKGE